MSTDWSLNLQLICGAPPGYKVVTMESPVDGTASKSVTASCPAGTKSLSAGWSVLDGTGAFLDGEALQLRMDDAGTSWTVKAVNRSTFATSYKVLLRVMCAASEGLTGYQIVKLSSAAATGPADLQVSCPSGKSPVFAGWTVLNGSGAPVDGRLAYSIAGVSDWKLGAAPVDSNSASLEARVICLD